MKWNKTADEKIYRKLKHYQDCIEQYIDQTRTDNIDYDENFESISKRNISNRDDSYTDLLQHFVDITKKRNLIKEIHKWIYFWIIMILTGSFVFFIFKIFNNIDFSNGDYINNLVIIVSSLVSFCSVIISIPLIITKYLFSSKEDKRISKIILHTQQHDIDGKRILESIKSKLEELDVNKTLALIDTITQMVQNAEKTGIGNDTTEHHSDTTTGA